MVIVHKDCCSNERFEYEPWKDFDNKINRII